MSPGETVSGTARTRRASRFWGILLVVALAACASPLPSPSPRPSPTSIIQPSGSSGPRPSPASPDLSTAAPEVTLEPTVEPVPPTPGIGGLEGLIADLEATGADVGIAGVANGSPLAPSQVIVCVDHENIRVFEFVSDDARAMMVAQIDPRDPSHIGDGNVVSWSGTPRFWQRDRVIVLYVGSGESTVAVLTSLLGEPFAQGRGRPLPRPDAC